MKYYAPSSVNNRYKQLLAGSISKHGKVTIMAKEHSEGDEEAMKRLISSSEMKEVWQAIPNEKEQLTFLNVLGEQTLITKK